MLTDGALALALDFDEDDLAPAIWTTAPENRIKEFLRDVPADAGENIVQFPYWRLENDTELRIIASVKTYAYVAGNPLNATDPSGRIGEALVLCADPTPAEAATCALGIGLTAAALWVAWCAVSNGLSGIHFAPQPNPPALPTTDIAISPAIPQWLVTANSGALADDLSPGIIMNASVQPQTLSAEEQAALERGDTRDPAYRSALQKIRFNEKTQSGGTRNQQKDRSSG